MTEHEQEVREQEFEIEFDDEGYRKYLESLEKRPLIGYLLTKVLKPRVKDYTTPGPDPYGGLVIEFSDPFGERVVLSSVVIGHTLYKGRQYNWTERFGWLHAWVYDQLSAYADWLEYTEFMNGTDPF